MNQLEISWEVENDVDFSVFLDFYQYLIRCRWSGALESSRPNENRPTSQRQSLIAVKTRQN